MKFVFWRVFSLVGKVLYYHPVQTCNSLTSISFYVVVSQSPTTYFGNPALLAVFHSHYMPLIWTTIKIFFKSSYMCVLTLICVELGS